MNYLLLDVGTSGMRGILADNEGNCLFRHSVSYSVRFLSPEHAEQDAEDWRNALVEICRKTAAYLTEEKLQLAAVSLTSQRSSIIPVDAEGNPLMPAVMWQDRRCVPVVEDLKEYSGEIFRLTGARPNTVYAGPKIAWVKRAFPELSEKADRYVTIADYLVFLMTGRWVTDETYGSRSLLMNLETRHWDDRLLDMMQTDRQALCTLVPPGAAAGRIRASFSLETGMPVGIPVISAGGDQQCAALGMGMTGPGRITAVLGTGAFTGTAVPAGQAFRDPAFTFNVHALPEYTFVEYTIPVCAALYDWAKKVFFSGEEDYEAVNRAVAAAPPGANGVICLCSFQGHGSSDWNERAEGAFLGLSLNTKKEDLVRSVAEALVCEVAEGVDRLKALACGENEAESLCVTGGLLKVPGLARMLADATGMTVTVMDEDGDLSAYGALLSAVRYFGLYRDMRAAWKKCTAGLHSSAVSPDPAKKPFYDRLRARLKDAYRRLNADR